MSWISNTLKELQDFKDRILHLRAGVSQPTQATEVTVEEEPVNYTDFRTDELKVMARERGLKGYYKLNKAQLCELLSKN